MAAKKETKKKAKVEKKDDKKVKAIIFDLWGTVLENGVVPSPTKQSKKILGLFQMNYPEFVLRFEKAFMTKKYDSIKDGLDLVFAEFNVNPKEYNRVDRLTGLWNKSKIMSRLYPETEKVLKELRKDYKLILLSNLPCVQADIIDRFKFRDYFDELFLSYEIGCIKSDGGYEIIMKNLGLSPDEIIMVGDSMESDIESAKKAGIKGILVDRRDTRDYQFKVMSLEDLPKVIDEVKDNG